MKIDFPSREFDDAVAAVCHGDMRTEQARALNELLRNDARARDEYILRLELHSKLASQQDLYLPAHSNDKIFAEDDRFPFPQGGTTDRRKKTSAKRKLVWVAGLAASLALAALGSWTILRRPPPTVREIAPTDVPSASAWKPSVTNLPGQDYPRIDPERRAQFRIKAPGAKQVSVNIGSANLGAPLTVTKTEDGVWTITTSPLGIGFHFYRVLIDGVSLADPATKIFRGGGGDWLSSAIEVPTGDDFHEVKNVPHGELREQKYFSRVTGTERRAFVYLPAGYDGDSSRRYPVLYLLHGGGEDETCWSAQGRVSQIMDNLIAEKMAEPMIVVMDSGVARRFGQPETSFRSSDSGVLFPTLDEVFMTDLIPMIDRTYRTAEGREHRALAGLSVGAAQALAIGLRHLDQFASIGSFSGIGQGRNFDLSAASGGTVIDPRQLNEQLRVLFLSAGEQEPDWLLSGVEQHHQALQAAGINHVYYTSRDTGHEWHTWRRSLHAFAPLLFKN